MFLLDSTQIDTAQVNDTFNKFIEILNIIDPISSIITLAGIITTIVLSKQIKTEGQKRNAIKFADEFKDIEYDIAEIMQLLVLKSQNIPFTNMHDINRIFHVFIAKEKNQVVIPNDYIDICLEKLCRTIYNYGSDYSVKIYAEFQKKYKNTLYEQNDDTNNDLDITELIALLSLLVTQIKYDAFGKNVSYKDWVMIRGPKSMRASRIYQHCERFIDELNLKNIEKNT